MGYIFMEDIRTYSVYPSNLNILSAFTFLKKYLTENGFKGGNKTNNSHMFSLKINRYRTLLADDFDEFLKILGQYPNALPLEIHTSWDKNPNSMFANYISISNSTLHVSVNTRDLLLCSAIHDKIQEVFNASNPLQDQTAHLSKYDQKKSIFIAHRFDEYGNKQAQILSFFLKRLGFDIKEGSGYEAKDIPDKVSGKIIIQDIFIILVTPGDTNWILSEAAFAKGHNKYIIIMCQDNMSFNQGILGKDYEHFLFPKDNIEKCFANLLYALPI